MPVQVQPPRSGELNDGDLEEVRDKAVDRWLNWTRDDRPAEHQTPEYEDGRARIEAAKELGNWRKTQRRHREKLEQLMASAPAETTGNRAEAVTEVRRLGEQKIIHIKNVTLDRVLSADELSGEQLESDLNSLARRYQRAGEMRPDDQRARWLGRLLMAVSHGEFNQLKELAETAGKWLDETNRGPGSRAQELASLRGLVMQARVMDPQRGAEKIVRTLLCRPILAGMAGIPLHGQWLPENRTHAIASVRAVLEAPPPVKRNTDPTNATAKSVMRALGAPEAQVKGLFEAERKAKSRKEKRADK
jgi:hypothetical protein